MNSAAQHNVSALEATQALPGNMLNLGCGNRFHPHWINVDMVSTNPAVIGHDLRTGIPFAEGRFKVVYHSHMLEHLPRSQTLPFLRECFRVLQPGGIIRVVVPDLEGIGRLYIQAIDAALTGDQQWQQNYEWIMLELYDQAVREQPMGEIQSYLQHAHQSSRAFVATRSADAQRLIEEVERQRKAPAIEPPVRSQTAKFLHHLSLIVRNPRLVRERVIRLLLGNEYELLKLGRFRHSGEIHLWMYDRYSLAKLLLQAGFSQPQTFHANESNIAGWSEYHLDTEPDGSIYKPDSLFMEAIRP